MDFDDDKLDYEEDDFENDFIQNDFQSINPAEDKTNESLEIPGFDDQYLQINCSEEEENFVEGIAGGSGNSKIRNDKKTDEEGYNVEQEKPETRIETCMQMNNLNENGNNNNNNNNNNSCSCGSNCSSNDKKNINCKTKNKKFKKKKRPFQHHRGIKKLSPNVLTFSSWLPNFSSANNVVKLPREPVYNEQILNLSQDFYSNSSSQFPLLELITAKVEQNLPQLVRISDRLLRHENVRSNFMRNENYSNMQNFSNRVRGFADNYQACEAKKNSKHWSHRNPNGNSADKDNKNFDGKNKESFFKGLYTPLKPEEKELVALKKEARLKRFMNDDVVSKGKKLISSSENKPKDDLYFGAEYFQKLEEQKLKREKLLSLKEIERKNSNFDSDKSASAEKPGINKELLLKKKNPFDANLRKSNFLLGNTMKQEKEGLEEIKQESFEKKSFSPQCLSVVKSGTGSSVKFVRTISKNFIDLALRKPNVKGVESNKDTSSNAETTLPFVAENSYSRAELPSKAESQLTGCIVKVFNIPPSTTVNDILTLCSSIGIVKEIKLNLPKENSAVIRFGEPTCADNFFGVYHGKKMNNYFLNVIVI